MSSSAEYQRNWYHRPENRERVNKIRREKYLAFHPRRTDILHGRLRMVRYRAKWKGVIDLLKAYPCSDCGGTFPPECMDFDHVRGTKRFTMAKSYNVTMIERRQELAKCELVCANCHRIRTHQQRQEKDRLRQFAYQEELEGEQVVV